MTAKDGLSPINGTSQMTAYSTIAQQELSELLILSDVVLVGLDGRSFRQFDASAP